MFPQCTDSIDQGYDKATVYIPNKPIIIIENFGVGSAGYAISGEWIKHDGACCPVSKEMLVDIRCKNGDVFYEVAASIKLEALSFFWQGSGSKFDIIEYRIGGTMER
ncbi:hypothetical protein [Nitrosospira sp. NpAV]|uniref:hypothetical protein n=1 Tax=Nitrosospira sp. NpAV TaxID=58133 RepID=UPI0005A22958|nr:hypothetical protein [Nitrosospira sp. NpAV]KIO49917.1 hypothetical protein SQ11_03120 [Nitrosospira sp. NpAV]